MTEPGFGELFFTGAYSIAQKDGRGRAVFFFAVHDLALVRKLFAGMYARLLVGRNGDGALAYTLDLPDRATPCWEIVPEPKDIPGLEEAARDQDCVTLVKGQGTDFLNLDPFARGLRHDWSGRESDAHRALGQGRVDEAQGIFETLVRERPRWPQARHGLGRCLRQRGDLEEAAACYLKALCVIGADSEPFPPFAAGILSDLGVVFKKLNDLDRAAVCLQWSLTMRPNHPEALGTAAAMLAAHEGIFMDALARMLAIGSRDNLAEMLARSYAQAMGKEFDTVLGDARKAAAGFDLSKPLDFADPPLTKERFFAAVGLETPVDPEKP